MADDDRANNFIGKGMLAIETGWDAGRLRLIFSAARDQPVALVDLEPTTSTVPPRELPDLEYAVLRQPLERQPLVELYVVGREHARSGERTVDSAVGRELRYRSHETEETATGRRLSIVQQHDDLGLEVTSILESRSGSSAITCITLVANRGPEPVVLTSLSSLVLPLDGSTAWIGLEHARLTWARSDWLAEARWVSEDVRAGALPDLGLDIHGQDPRGSFQVSSTGAWSTGRFLPVGVLEDASTRMSVAWQINSASGWTWELGERRQGLYVLLQGPDERRQHWRQELEPGSVFESVSATFAFSFDGADGALGELTAHRRAARRPHPDLKSLPPVFNDYMNTLDGDSSTAALLPLVRAAGLVGAKYFVIDAGWYDSHSWWDAVGEWTPSASRFPLGLGEVTDAIRASGMRPGLWLEPEVIGVRSPLADRFPADAFVSRGGAVVKEHGRLHLDLRHPAAIAHLDSVVDRLVGDFGVRYFKFDYNITAGIGTDRNASSAGAGQLEMDRARLRWVASVLDRHPGLAIENCASGAMRADPLSLSVFQLQSTSDQQNWLRYPPISASAAASMAPEQAASWAYPQADMSDEEIAFTLVTSLLGRFYLSGFLDRMSEPQLALVSEAVRVNQSLAGVITEGRPVWPLGLPLWDDPVVAFGLEDGAAFVVSVWMRGGVDRATLALSSWRGSDVSVQQIFPGALAEWAWEWNATAGELTFLPAATGPSARTFRITGNASR